MVTDSCEHCDEEGSTTVQAPRDVAQIARELATAEHLLKHTTAMRDRLRDELIDAYTRELHADLEPAEG